MDDTNPFPLIEIYGLSSNNRPSDMEKSNWMIRSSPPSAWLIPSICFAGCSLQTGGSPSARQAVPPQSHPGWIPTYRVPEPLRSILQ
mgnify:CR=1 FL=1